MKPLVIPLELQQSDHDKVYEAVYSFCEALISEPRVIEFKEVRNEADKGWFF